LQASSVELVASERGGKERRGEERRGAKAGARVGGAPLAAGAERPKGRAREREASVAAR